MRQRKSSFFFFSSRRRHTRCSRDWSSDVCSSDLEQVAHETRGDPLLLARGLGDFACFGGADFALGCCRGRGHGPNLVPFQLIRPNGLQGVFEAVVEVAFPLPRLQKPLSATGIRRMEACLVVDELHRTPIRGGGDSTSIVISESCA